MNYRYMRLLLMFDLPVETSDERKAYRHFVKYIKGEGFIIMQKSIYTKLLINDHAVNSIRVSITKHLPDNGIVSLLSITEKQFQTIDNLLGMSSNITIGSDEKYIEL